MKKVKMLTVILLIISMLTGCFAEEKPINSNHSNSSTVESNSNNIETVTIQPQKTPKPKIQSPKPKETSNENESKNVPKNNVKEINGFVLLSSLDKDIVIDVNSLPLIEVEASWVVSPSGDKFTKLTR